MVSRKWKLLLKQPAKFRVVDTQIAADFQLACPGRGLDDQLGPFGLPLL